MKRSRTVRDVVSRGSERLAAGTTSRNMVDASASKSLAGRVNPKWTWHHGVLISLRERLLQERRERLVEAAQPLEPHSMDSADSATDECDHNLALAALSAEQDALYEIDAAIRRIHSGSYGVCEATGKPIPAARLKAVPWTRFAREVEARYESEGKIRPPHLGALGSVRGGTNGNLEPIEPEERDLGPDGEGPSVANKGKADIADELESPTITKPKFRS
jgi:RNA polymerase-binding protein DksA